MITTLANRISLVGLAWALFVSVGHASQKQDFSGQYLLEIPEAQRGASMSQRLVVQQSDGAIEVTVIDGDKKTTNRFSLNGSEGPYTSLGGVTGKCKGKFHGGNLVLESVVVTHSRPFAPPVTVHTKEKWHLSSDLKTLTVISEIEFPESSPEVGMVTGAYASGTRRYMRVGIP